MTGFRLIGLAELTDRADITLEIIAHDEPLAQYDVVYTLSELEVVRTR
jgi:hypothetical protein